MTVTELPAPALRKVVGATERIATGIAIVGTCIMLFATTIDVIGRATTGRGVPGTVEITEVLLVITVFMGMATAATEDLHIRATLVTDRLNPRIRRPVRLVGDIVGMAMVAWLIYATAVRAVASIGIGEYRFGLVSMPIWPARVAIVVGLLCMLLAMILKTIDRFHEIGTDA